MKKLLALITFMLAATCAHAVDLQQQLTFNIQPQSLSSALLEFGRQANVQIMSSTTELAARESHGVSGKYSLAAALEKILMDTGLRYRAAGDGTIMVMPQSSKTALLRDSDEGAVPIQLVQAQNDSDQRPSRQESVVEEIVVTAQKRAQRLFDVPISIVAMSADELQKRKITSIDDLALAVPGLSIQSDGGLQRRVMLRGISNGVGSNSSLIGLYLDEASATSGADLQLDLRTYDLERVEVLRGPQGTLYGEGSVGGTIRFITKNPVLNRFGMKADVGVLFTQDGSSGQRIEGVLNVPLIENELGLRIAGAFDHAGGWIDQPAANVKNFNEQNLTDVRVKGLWQPTAQFTVNAMAVIHRNDALTNTGEDANGDYTQVFNLTTVPRVQDDYDLTNLTLTYDFAAVRVLSTTSYIEQDKVQQDFGFRLPNTPPGPSSDVYKPLYTRNTDILNEELRFTSSGSGPWQWTVGGFYRRATIDNFNTFNFGLPIPPGTPLPALTVSPNYSLSKSKAVFGDTSYRLTDRFTLGTGLRYFEDDQEFTSGTPLATQKGRFHALNPRAYAQYGLTDRVNTYASAAKGFRSGGFNRLNQPSFGPENVWTYELGTKMSLLQGRLSADAAIFHSDYENYQISGLLPPPAVPVNITSNAGSARIRGFEWGLVWYPMDEWALSFNGNYVDTEFVEITTVPNANGTPSSNYAVGDPLDLFPKYGYTVSAQRDFKRNGRGGFVRLDYNQHGRATYRNRRSGPWYFSESDIINMLNFNMSLQWNDSLSLGVFAQNILNDRGFIDPFSIEEDAARSRPRTFGIQFGVTFD